MMPTSLITAAAPTCGVDGCEQPVKGLEQSWDTNGDGDWVPRQFAVTCPLGHRRVLEHF